MPPIDSDLMVRDWLKTATPGTVIQGKVSRFQFVVTERRTLNALSPASPANARTALTNVIANYKITLPEGTKPTRPKAGDRVRVTIEGTVTKYAEEHSDAFEMKTDDRHFVFFPGNQPRTVEVITPPLTTKQGTVLEHIYTGTKLILVGRNWIEITDGISYGTSAVEQMWETGKLKVSTI